MSKQVIYKYLPQNCRLAVINASFGGAQLKPGVETAPTALINAGLKGLLDQIGRPFQTEFRYPDYASLKPQHDSSHRRMNNSRWVSAATKSIHEQVYEQVVQQNQVLTLGGDHSIAIGTLTGVKAGLSKRLGADQPLGILYIDAHADLSVPEDSESGNIHGMALAFASGLAVSQDPGIFDWIKTTDEISLDWIVYIGLRDVDETEKKTIRDRHIRSYWMEDVRKLGIEDVMRQALKHLGDVPIHVSFDIDGLDPSLAPSTGLPVPGGLTLEEATFIMSSINKTGRLIAMDLVELNPKIGDALDSRRTLESAFAVINAGLATK